MSTPQGGQAPEAKDTFLKSLDALKQTLLIDSPMKRRLNQDVDQRLYEERQAYEKKIEAQKVQIELLDKKLADSASKAEREQSLRATLEKIESATKELSAQLKETETSSTPMERKITALEAELKEQDVTSKGEKVRLDEQTKASTQERQEASTKHDAIAARLLSAQKLTQELTSNLTASLKSLVDEKAHHKDFVRALQNANKILVKAIQSGKAAKEIIAKELAAVKADLEETQGLLQQVTEQSEGGDKSSNASSKGSEEKLERAIDELQDPQREILAGKKERDELKALVKELKEKNKSLTQDDRQTEEYEDMKSQLLANKITLQQNKKLNELLQKKVERLAASEASLKKELLETQQGKEPKKLRDKEVDRLTASEASLKKELEEAQRKPKGDHALAATPDEEEGKEVKDELVLAEQEVKRSRLRIQSLEKQVQQARKETDLLKREVERTKKRDSTDAQLAESGDSPGPKKPKSYGV